MISFEIIFLSVLALIWIIFATVQDLRKREVANWLNFSLIIFALGFRFFYSLFNENFNFFYQGLIGLGIFFVLGNLFYYGRIFAGGDAKLMIALGTVLPFNYTFLENSKIFISFLFIFFFIGAFYGLFVSIFLTIKHFKKFKKELKKQFKKNKHFVLIFLVIGLGIFGFGFLNELFFIFGGMIFFFPYLYLYAKAIDKVCMIKNVEVSNLGEGDWLYNNVQIGKDFIKASWDGLTEKQIKQIQRKYKMVKIRQGIPFVPVFLISFIILMILFYFGIIDDLWNFWF
ncbi:MAG: A24 family peptidase [Nanoarchaeota archaeon]